MRIGIDCGSVIVETHISTGKSTIIGMPLSQSMYFAEISRSGVVCTSRQIAMAVSDKFLVERVPLKSNSRAVGPDAIWTVNEAGPPSTRSPEYIVGRDLEMGQFINILENVKKNSVGHVVVVRGEAGIGKSHLMRALMALAHAADYACYEGKVSDYGVQRGRAAIKSIIRARLGLDKNTESLNEAGRLLAELDKCQVEKAVWPFIFDLLDLPIGVEIDNYYSNMNQKFRERKRIEVFCELFKNDDVEKCSLICVDDVHWEQSYTIELLRCLKSATNSRAILLLLVARNEPSLFDQVFRAEHGGVGLTTMELAPLRYEEVQRLANNLGPFDPTFAESCIKRSEGNALYLRQLLLCEQRKNNYKLPITILGAIRSRVEGLSAKNKILLQAASVVGTHFSEDLIEFLVQRDEVDLKELLALRLIRQSDGGYVFDHALIADATYGSLLKSMKQWLHRRAAEWFKDRNVTLWAYHLEMAGDPSAAGTYAAAALVELQKSRVLELLDLVERGLTLPQRRSHAFELRLLKAELLLHIGKVDESTGELQKALNLADEGAETCKVWLFIAANLVQSDKYQEAEVYLKRAEATAVELDRADLLARTHHLFGNLNFPLGRIEKCSEHQTKALQFARAAGSVELETRALSGLGDTEYASGRMSYALRQFERCLQLAREHGFHRIEIANRHMVPSARHYLGPLHLVQVNNTLSAEIELAAGASNTRERNGVLLTDEHDLIVCGGYGQPERHSDPTIGAAVNALARADADITLANPVGIYFDALSTAGWQTPDGSDPADFWTITRGTPEKPVRAVLEVPDDRTFVVGDITINGSPIRFGAQIADFITMKLTGQATRIGQSHYPPIAGCKRRAAGVAAGRPQLDVKSAIQLSGNLMGYEVSFPDATYHAFYDDTRGYPKPDDGRPVYEGFRPEFTMPQPA